MLTSYNPFKLLILLILAVHFSAFADANVTKTAVNSNVINDNVNDKRNSSNILIASGHGEYPPFMYRQGEKIVGVGADLTTMIFGELGITVDSRYVGAWDRGLRKAELGEIDVIIGIYKNAQRLTYLNYPEQPYIKEPVAIFTQKKHSFAFDQWSTLIDKIGGTVIGESFGPQFDLFAEQKLNLQRVSTMEQVFNMLARNRIQYAVYALYPGMITLAQMGLDDEITSIPIPIAELPAYQAFSKKSKFSQHLNYFNRRLTELKAQGTVGTLIDKHMQLLAKKDLGYK